MIDQIENPLPSKNTLEVLRESLWNFLKPLSKSPKPGTTGIAAIKKEQLSEHGRIPLSKQQQQNIEAGTGQ